MVGGVHRAIRSGRAGHLPADESCGGQQQKVQPGMMIRNTPQSPTLDEPIRGFDPINRRLPMDISEDQQEAGATMVMVTHQGESVERLHDGVTLLEDDHSHAYDAVREVTEQLGGTTYRPPAIAITTGNHPVVVSTVAA